MAYLPINAQEMKKVGWDRPDFIYVSGDAYVDHPSFGVAIISRLLESKGYKVVILAQPSVQKEDDFIQFGRPRLGFLVTAGAIDSMVAHYTAAKRLRSEDAYSPGNKAGLRPDRAVNVYCRKIRDCYPETPIIIGGLEASLRRFAHYDYWEDKVLPSILVSSGADLCSFGMGEHAITEIADRLNIGEDIRNIRDVRGTCYLGDLNDPVPNGAISIASFDKVASDKETYAKACRIQLEEQDAVTGRTILQKHGDRILVQNPPSVPLTQSELDAVAELPYMRYYHPSYEILGGVPAIQEVEFSLTHNRGCFGACNFCSIQFHQGRYVSTRSHESLLREARMLSQSPHFKGYIHDVGGPTANFRGPSCLKQEKNGLCKDKKCLAPTRCAACKPDHEDYLQLLRKLRQVPGVKKVFIRSGLRYDYIMGDTNRELLEELAEHHVSGYLKVAPEHCSSRVLDMMGKPHIGTYYAFQKAFYEAAKKKGKEIYIIPYLMSSHPGSTMKDAVELALFIKKNNLRPQQVQDFYPTPGTASTCMFYTGINPWTMERVYVPKDPYEKKLQRTLMQYFKPENRRFCIEALCKAGCENLIGHGPDCLVQPDQEYLKTHRQEHNEKNPKGSKHKNSSKRS